MIETVKNFLLKYDIKDKNVVIACSTGADSCALSLIMLALKKELNLKLCLAYFNHGWRKEAIEEEKYTKVLAKRIGANYIIGRAPSDIAKTEETARELRYSFLEAAAKEFQTDVVLLAHNKNDNVETLVYRIIKGTSIKGLMGIPEKRDIFYRPMLDITKGEIQTFLKVNKQDYCNDESNSDNKYKRNYIRNELIPKFYEINNNYLSAIDNLSRLSGYAQKIVHDTIEKIENEIIQDEVIDYNKYCALEIPYRLEILNDFIGDKLKYRDYKTLTKLDDFIINNKSSRISLNACEFLRTRWGTIFIERRDLYGNTIENINIKK